MLGRRTAIAQVHCHQHAIMGFDPDAELLKACGVEVDVLDSGCCGLAGNFGFEAGHYEVSVACAEHGPVAGGPGRAARRPPCWPTGSPAGPRSRPVISAARASTSPSYWLG